MTATKRTLALGTALICLAALIPPSQASTTLLEGDGEIACGVVVYFYVANRCQDTNTQFSANYTGATHVRIVVTWTPVNPSAQKMYIVSFQTAGECVGNICPTGGGRGTSPMVLDYNFTSPATGTVYVTIDGADACGSVLPSSCDSPLVGYYEHQTFHYVITQEA